MEMTVQAGNVLDTAADLAILATYEEVGLPDALAGLLEADDYKGSAKQTALLYPRGAVAPRRVLLVGLGKQEDLHADLLREAAASGVQQAQKLQAAQATFGVQGEMPLEEAQAAQAIAEGLALGAYRYLRYRTNLKPEQSFAVEAATLLVENANDAIQRGFATGEIIARGVSFARDLVNTPGADLPPAALGDAALAMGQRLGLKVTVLDKAELEAQGFGGVLAVGKGSANEPRFIVMEYGLPSDESGTICLVGKGLTFDSGGLSLKPNDAMTGMKADMGGAAAVFGSMQAIAELKPKLHVVGIVPSAENMPGPDAYRPDDVVTTRSGKTVEVLNTDAEGRIVLADGLHYAQQYKPAAIISLATLTGAAIIALGHHAIALMATDQPLAERVQQAGDATRDRVWQLPLWQEYREQIKSEIADIKNIGGRPAGTITAGAFLAEFVGEYPFVHLDVAGTAFVDKPRKTYEQIGGTGSGVRLLIELLTSYAG